MKTMTVIFVENKTAGEIPLLKLKGNYYIGLADRKEREEIYDAIKARGKAMLWFQQAQIKFVSEGTFSLDNSMGDVTFSHRTP